MKVEQFLHANQFIITDDNGNIFFQSYNSIICKLENDKILLDYNTWDYSNTTTRHLKAFINNDELFNAIKKANKKAPFENNKEYIINNGYKDFIIQFTNLNV